MEFNRKLVLNLFVGFCFIIFMLLFYYNFRTLGTEEWVAIVTLTGIAALFEVRPVVLLSGEHLSLIGPLLYTAGILFGYLPVLYMVLLLAVILIVQQPRKLSSHFFNSIQYGVSAYVAVKAYQIAGGQIGNFHLANAIPYLAFALTMFSLNVIFVSGFLTIRSGIPLTRIVPNLLERHALLMYFTLMAFGLFMSVILQSEGLAGVVFFSIILWLMGSIYRRYYEMVDHFRSLAIKDELTGLYNHRYFQEKLQEFINKGDTLSLLLLDLDFFKLYNDMYGHPEGDKLLHEIAQVINKRVPENGIFCRYGGEEFAVLLPGSSAEAALEIAETIRVAVSEHQFHGMDHMPKQRITVSIGVSTYPDMANSKENLMMLADEALYKVKYTSRNKVQLYSSVVDELKGSFHFGTEEMEIIQMIKTFLTIINSKDRYTYGHTERDMEYAEALARKMNLAEEDIKILRYGALLHDIGKVEVPTEVLNKKTKLTADEWETMKMHVIWGVQIVEPIHQLEPCLPIIRHHHERYDGKGYPDGLAGTDIPLSARILSVVDSFDAMTTNRPYQKTKSIPEAIEELRRCSGTQFDPELVEPFIEVIREMRLIEQAPAS